MLKYRFKVYPELETRNTLPQPSSCPPQGSKTCESTSFQFVEGSTVCQDYQEIKIQESTQVLGVGAIPRSIPIILTDDLVDIVKAGDDVIVTGVLTAKWSSDLKDVRCDLDPVLIANHVRRLNELKSDIDIPDDVIMTFKQFWLDFKDMPLKGRNAIVRGVCPQIFGLFTVKLAVALTLIGGVQHVDASGTKVRGESHLLLVGDPGTGKSQFLKFAAKLSSRSVITTGLGSTSAGLTVTAVKDGDDVIVTGVLTAKWSSDLKDVRCDLDPVLIANHVRRLNELKSDIDIPDDVIMTFKQFWLDFKDMPLKGRNAIVRGVCPQIFGLFTVKLAVALTLIGGVQHVDASGTKVRGESHLLLVGDPGTGKSQFLKFAAKLSSRSVITTGLGSTSAGLTVTAVKDGGEWMLEAGALVLADGGLCCIDEFDSMREHDRATIHEAMEQQTISIAKAGLVTTLNTRTIVFGATNPKGQYDPSQPLSVNTALSGPLLSRFDIVLVLLDTKNPEWDAVVSSHILGQAEPENGKREEDLANIWPLPMLRRYIHFVKRYFKPVLTKEAEKVISSYYQLQRRSAVQNAARTTVRMLESLIRLAQAHARLMFRNEVTRLDAITAILCIESSMTTSAIVDSIGNALHSNFTENPDQEYAKQEKLILDKLTSIDEFPVINNIAASISG
ncbi:DNA helicase [Actinidia chinensis var. chinensis]|uniref:Probable DNA helicase MCM9 n=1 Tax=Actinidia chinensis var. chinensis TaxID=1590841 RepID=A0A2R6Q686_ACTCC|nr:DNA helicase [Actinidia chinensis var. chinensis]